MKQQKKESGEDKTFQTVPNRSILGHWAAPHLDIPNNGPVEKLKTKNSLHNYLFCVKLDKDLLLACPEGLHVILKSNKDTFSLDIDESRN